MQSPCIATAAVALMLNLSAMFASPASAQGVIAPGETLTGAITPAGDSDTWTFSANTGDAIVVRVGEITQTGSFAPRIRLFDPSAALLGTASTSIAAEIAVTAAASGTFTVIVDDAVGTTATGTYRLTLAKTGSTIVVSPGDEGGPLTNGLMHTGTIDVGDLDVWTVTANAGEAIVVRMGETVAASTLTPWLRLYSPTGTLLASNFSTIGAEVTATAPSSGTYLVVAGDASGSFSGSGAYRLTLAKTGSAVAVSPGDEGGPLTNGAMHTGTIDVGDLDLWTLTANAGDSIVVRMGETVANSTLTPWLRLYSPGGTLLSSNFSTIGAEVAATAGSNGTFLVVVGDASGSFSGSGAYRLTLAKTGAPVVVSPGDEGGPLTNGAVHTGTIDVGDLDVWTLTANAGASIIVRMSETVAGSPLTPYLRIYGPTGAILDSNFSTIAAEVAVTAASSGTFLVVAGDASGSFSGSGAYRLTLAQTGAAVTVSPGDEGGPLTNGAMHTGTIDVGDLDLWTVSALAGEAIVVRMGETVPGSSLTPWLRIYSPAGALLDSSFSTIGAEVSITAGTSGTFLVIAADASGSFSGSGAYRLTLAKTGSAVTVSPGDEGGPLTNGAMHTGTIDVGDLDVWTVHANVGESIVVRMGETVPASTLTPWLRIYSPAGVLLDSSFSTIAAEVAVTAASNGMFLVIAGDASGSFSGSGAYRLTLAKTATPVVVSPGDEGGPLPNGVSNGIISVGDLDVWTLGAQVGDQLVITMTETTVGSPLTPWVRIYSPTGTLLSSIFGAATAQVSVTTTTSGIFLVVVGDASGSFSGSGPYTLTTNGASGFSPPILDIDASGPPTKYDPFTDGLLVLRYLFELSGPPLTAGALGGTAKRVDPVTVQVYLDSIRAALDVDGNGTPDALTDGLLIVRYMMGLRGDALITGAFDPTAPRKSALTIEPYLQGLMP